MRKRGPSKRRIDAERAGCLYQQGVLVGDIAQELECSVAYIYQLMSEHKVPRKKADEWEAKKTAAIGLFKSDPHATVAIIAPFVGVHYSTVARWLRAAGIDLNNAEAACPAMQGSATLRLPESTPEPVLVPAVVVPPEEPKETEEW